MHFKDFSQFLEKLETISSRLEMTAVLAELYDSLDVSEIPPASYLMLGSLVPSYKSLEFQLSTKMVVRSLARVPAVVQHFEKQGVLGQAQDLFGQGSNQAQEEQITKLYKQKGDLGLVAESLLVDHTPTTQLSITQVYDELFQIAKDRGIGSQERKVESLAALLEKLEAGSAKFVVRMVIGKLRLGFSTMTIIDALSVIVTGDKSDHDMLEAAYQKKADVGALAQIYLAQPREDAQKRVEEYSVQVGIPVVPALCQRLNSAQEIVAKMGSVLAEPKYDGLRAQVHIDKKSNSVKAFTRNLEDASHMFPELEQVMSQINCESCILDAEVIGINPQTGEHSTFQETITRKRKHNIIEASAKVPLRFYVFDILELNGRPLLTNPLAERKKLLRSLFADSDVLQMTEDIETDNVDELRAYHESQLGQGLEGIVAKKADSPYLPGRKGWSWVKIKEAEGTSGKLSDTLDVIVMGYYAGRGKRSQVGIGAILVGVLDQTTQEVQTIAKIGTGISDDQLKDIKQRCDAIAVDEKPAQYTVAKELYPDIWVEPKMVVEVAADEITKSPNHTAGKALRFPRLLKLRTDKSWSEATTSSELGSF